MDSTPATQPPGPAAPTATALQFGPFVLDRVGGRLLRDGQPLDVAPRPWAVLCFLAERPGRLITKDELLDSVWGHRFVSESALKVTINSLRQVLGEDARDAQWVQTVPRRGYRFHEAVEPVARSATGAVAGPAVTAPDRPAATRPAGNLPWVGAALVGREQALAQLAEALPAHRLVTLVGPGGVGKTRLALSAAAEAAPGGGAWLVRLDEVEGPEAVCRLIARTLGLGEAAGESPETLADALAPLAVRLLLDNAEHVADGLAPQVALWLQRAPQLSILVTSQRPLQVSAERVWPVAPLELPPDAADPPALRANPAVTLMVQVLQAQRRDWEPGAGDLTELVAIARALDGLPLALELAAARVPLLGAAGVRQRLDARLKMLTGGRADAPARHRTLRASIEWSVGLLPPVPARALERLAVFVGGFTTEAAQAVLAPALPGADEWMVLDALKLLQDMALLAGSVATDAAGNGSAGVPRLRMLDSVRLFGLERLAAANDLAAAQSDHRAWVLRQFLAAEEAYLAMGVERWLAPLEAEAQNLIAAMDHGLDALGSAAPSGSQDNVNPAQAGIQGFHGQVGLAIELASLAAACTPFCLRTGLGRSLKRWRDQLSTWMDAHQIDLPRQVQGRWLLSGAMLGGQGLINTREALPLGEQAVALLTDAPARRQLALYVTGVFQLRLKQRDALADTLARMRELPDEAGASPYVRCLRPMLEASVAQADGDQAAYLAYWTDALAESRALGDRFEAWRAAWGVGQARYLQGDLDAAIDVMDEAIDEIRATGRMHTQAGFAGQAVFIRLARDCSDETLARLKEVIPIVQSSGILLGALGDALAWVPLRQGRLADALRVQSWVDARIATEKAVRSPVAQRLRDRFAQETGNALPGDAPPLDEAGALRVVAIDAPPSRL